VRELLILILPVALGAGVVQINLVIDIILASFLPEGSISYLFYADRLNQLPLGVVGVALGTALLPLLSRQIAAGENEAANRSLNRGIELTLLLAIPAAAALAVTGQEIITTLFQRGAFSAAQSQATAMALMAYAVGLPAYVLIKVLGPGYFARRDTKTPVRIALVAMAVNIVLNLILMQYFYHAGLALATAISAWLNAGLMAAGLIRRGHLVPDMRLRRRLPAIVGATAIMALVLWGVSDRLSMGAASPEWQRFAALSALVVIGLVVFILAGFLFKAFSLDDLRALRSRNK